MIVCNTLFSFWSLSYPIVIDGNQESLPYTELRPLDQQFRKLDGQAKNAVLSLVQLLGPETDYGAEAFDRFRDLTEVREDLEMMNNLI